MFIGYLNQLPCAHPLRQESQPLAARVRVPATARPTAAALPLPRSRPAAATAAAAAARLRHPQDDAQYDLAYIIDFVHT